MREIKAAEEQQNEEQEDKALWGSIVMAMIYVIPLGIGWAYLLGHLSNVYQWGFRFGNDTDNIVGIFGMLLGVPIVAWFLGVLTIQIWKHRPHKEVTHSVDRD